MAEASQARHLQVRPIFGTLCDLVAERRLTNSERRLRRITAEEPEQGQRGILELFRDEEPERLDEDAPLVREGDEPVA